MTLSNLDHPSDPCGPSVPLTESLGPPERIQPGVYWSASRCPSMRPGDTLELRIVVDGEVVTGRTVIPGANAMV